MTSQTQYEKNQREHLRLLRSRAEIEADLRMNLECLGGFIAAQFNYHQSEPMDAIYRYLIDKHHWLPSQVRQLSDDDLRLVLEGGELEPLWDQSTKEFRRIVNGAPRRKHAKN